MDLRELKALSSGSRHPWETARYDFFSSLLAKHDLMSVSGNVLDAGAGDGWFANRLTQELPVTRHAVCWDHEYTPQQIEQLTHRVSERVIFMQSAPTDTFSLILLLDVLEHVQDDASFLRSIVSRNLASDGYMLISVPAWQCVFSPHDTFLGHYRRYSPANLKSLLEIADLEPVERGDLFHSLLVLRAFQALMRRALPAPHTSPPATELHWNHGRLISACVATALKADTLVSIGSRRLGIRLPGLSTWALCRKRR